MQPFFVLQASRELAGLLYLASLRAWGRGRTEVGTEDLLFLLVRRVPILCSALQVDARDVRSVIAATRSDARSGWRSVEADQGGALAESALEVDATFREVDWRARLKRRPRRGEKPPSYTGAVKEAVRSAFVHAQSYGRRYVGPMHLLAGMLQLPDCHAVEVIEQRGGDPDTALSRLPMELMKLEGLPNSAAIDVLDGTGLIADRHADLIKPFIRLYRAVAALTRSSYWRVGGFKPMILAMDEEASRLAVRYGAGYVNQAHYLLAIFLLQRQLDQYRLRLTDRFAPYNDAGDLLRYAGVAEQPLTTSVLQVRGSEATEYRRRPRGVWTGASPPFGRSVIAATERAEQHATRLRHPYAGTNHLLLGLLDSEGAATHVLRQLDVDLGQLRQGLKESFGLDRQGRKEGER